MSETQNITQMLRLWSDGNREVLEDLMPLVYDELHRQAARFLSRERRDHTLQTTELIHETYLKLVDQREVNWDGLRQPAVYRQSALIFL
jgi:DNA-directed RNA polymerase specialized sigma24 family protein